MNPKILIVEDDFVSATVAEQLFRAQGCEVDLVYSGEDAIEQYEKVCNIEDSYSGIYMDIGLPIKSGIETTLALRASEKAFKARPTVIIAVTANKDEKVTAACFEAGMKDVISKPLTPEKVMHFLQLCR